jgi:hypothetical protein
MYSYVIQKGYYVRGQLAPVDAATPTEVAFVFFILLWCRYEVLVFDVQRLTLVGLGQLLSLG